MQALHFSALAHNRVLKVARAMADLGGSESTRPDDAPEDIQFRSVLIGGAVVAIHTAGLYRSADLDKAARQTQFGT